MKVKAVGKTHLLLILSAAEARLLGISTCCGCAMLLRTRLPLFRYGVCTPHRFHCPLTPQAFSLPTASVLLDCVAHLCRVPHLFRSAALYHMDNGYHLVAHSHLPPFIFPPQLDGRVQHPNWQHCHRRCPHQGAGTAALSKYFTGYRSLFFFLKYKEATDWVAFSYSAIKCSR